MHIRKVKDNFSLLPNPPFNYSLWSHPTLRGLFLLIKDKVKAERQKIASEFKQLHQCLEEQECLLMARLGELERQIETRVKEKADKLSKRIFHLDGLIREKEESQLSGCEFPQVRSTRNTITVLTNGI